MALRLIVNCDKIIVPAASAADAMPKGLGVLRNWTNECLRMRYLLRTVSLGVCTSARKQPGVSSKHFDCAVSDAITAIPRDADKTVRRYA